jgi:hypothetical protein
MFNLKNKLELYKNPIPIPITRIIKTKNEKNLQKKNFPLSFFIPNSPIFRG